MLHTNRKSKGKKQGTFALLTGSEFERKSNCFVFLRNFFFIKHSFICTKYLSHPTLVAFICNINKGIVYNLYVDTTWVDRNGFEVDHYLLSITILASTQINLVHKSSSYIYLSNGKTLLKGHSNELLSTLYADSI